MQTMYTNLVLIQNFLILSTIQKISGKQRKVLVLVCALLFRVRQEKVTDQCMKQDLRHRKIILVSTKETPVMIVMVKRGHSEGF